MDEQPPPDVPVNDGPPYDCFECGSTIVEGRCPYCSKPKTPAEIEAGIERWHASNSSLEVHEYLEISREAYALHVEKPHAPSSAPPPSSAKSRLSPWYSAKDELKTAVLVPPFTALIANLNPRREYIRLGVLINGRESSITVPFELAVQFLDQVRTLIAEKGVR